MADLGRVLINAQIARVDAESSNRVGRNQMSDNVPCHVCGERAVHLPEEKPACHKHTTNASSSVILWGGTGQAKVIRPILEAAGHRVVMVFDNARIVPPFADVPMGGDWNDFETKMWMNSRL
jgi:hypothetical protein